jgi:hypothetical protein
VYPMPPHWPYSATVPALPVLEVPVAEDVGVVPVPDPEEKAASLLLTKVNAACPYSVP